MTVVEKTSEFDKWLRDLRDSRAKAKILVRIQRLANGNPGDAEPVGNGVSEMRIHYGPGYRIYFKEFRQVAVILWAGDKDTQTADIQKAKDILAGLEE